MKKIVFALVAVMLALSLLPAVYAEGTKATVTDAYIPFEVWRGEGDASVTVSWNPNIDPLLKADEFVSLETGGSELDIAYYTLTSDSDGRAVVTLKEDYLKTLQNGKAYYYRAVFKKAMIALRLFVVTEKATITNDLIFLSGVDGPWDGKTMPDEPWDGKSDLSVTITGNDDFSFGPEIFQKLVFDTVVDPSNYTVRGYTVQSFGDTVSVNLKAEYARRFVPGIFGFIAVFENADVILNFDTSYTYMPGDPSGDAAVTAEDARLALRAAAKLETLSGDAFTAADISDTGEITAADARKILRVAAKLEELFPYMTYIDDDNESFLLRDLYARDPQEAVRIADTVIAEYDGKYTKKLQGAIQVKAMALNDSSTPEERNEYIKFCEKLMDGAMKDKEDYRKYVLLFIGSIDSWETLSYVVDNEEFAELRPSLIDDKKTIIEILGDSPDAEKLSVILGLLGDYPEPEYLAALEDNMSANGEFYASHPDLTEKAQNAYDRIEGEKAERERNLQAAGA
ncbi:MAG: hypothetical protein IJM45_11090 [Clostridia bacterium]|nr:hypothetical protein [Clostridia bacterium]